MRHPCPKCSDPNDPASVEESMLMRRYKCPACGHHWRTTEVEAQRAHRIGDRLLVVEERKHDSKLDGGEGDGS